MLTENYVLSEHLMKILSEIDKRDETQLENREKLQVEA